MLILCWFDVAVCGFWGLCVTPVPTTPDLLSRGRPSVEKSPQGGALGGDGTRSPWCFSHQSCVNASTRPSADRDPDGDGRGSAGRPTRDHPISRPRGGGLNYLKINWRLTSGVEFWTSGLWRGERGGGSPCPAPRAARDDHTGITPTVPESHWSRSMPANTRCELYAGLMLGQRRRRLSSINPA